MPLNFNQESALKTPPNNQMFEDKKEKEPKKRKEYVLQNPQYKFADIILDVRQKEEIMLAVGFEQHKNLLMETWNMKKRYLRYGGLFINLYGESGTGKTMTAHAIADYLGKKVLLVNYAEIESKYVGETSKNLVDIFSYAEDNNAVLIFDEADALLSKRVTHMTNSTDVSVNQTKSVLLNIMNEYHGVVVFTTNFIENYDFAFMRRIPFQIKFSLPNEEQRLHIWEYYLDTDMPSSLDLKKVCKEFDGISGSDIANSVLMAGLHAAMDGNDIVTEEYFIQAIKNILDAKRQNALGEAKVVSQREVTEEYALKQIGGK